jgi:uncharacterized membrane protein YgcG
MANILIGSSNVARFYKIDKFKDFRQYNMAKCTTIESFRATISELEEGVAIISIFENLIVDAAKNLDKDDSALEKAILLSINEVMALVKTTAERMPGTKIGIVTPLARPSIKWFQGKFDLMFGHIRKSIADMGATCNNVFMIDCMCTSLQQFEQDGVHLTADSGVCFIEDILGKGEKAFKAVRVDLTNDQEESSGEVTLATTNSRIDNMVDRLTRRFDSDNLMFARIREELDAAANLKREDRVVVNGVTSKNPLPTDNRQRLEKLKELAMEIFKEIKPDFAGKILFASQGRTSEGTLPNVEVKLDKVEHAIAIRKAFAMAKKNGELKGQLEKVFIANSVNPPTRVRIEIMKAIAKKISTARDQAYVVGFIPRPVMHIKKQGDQAPYKTYSFVDAVKYHGGAVEQEDLGGAYARAGRAYDGQLQQNFILLRDSESGQAQNQFHAARQARGRGRGRGSGYATSSGSATGSGSGSGSGNSGRGGAALPARGEKRKGDKNEEPNPKKL